MFTVSSMRSGVRRALLLAAIATGVSGCGVDKQSAPPLTGPSELGLSLTLTATPDQVVRDGSSRSVVTVIARDGQNRPVAGQLLNAVQRALNNGKTEIFDYQLTINGSTRDYEARIVASGEAPE